MVVSTPTTSNNDFETIEAIVSNHALMNPDFGLSFGYIGNLERNRDDRAWYIFTKFKSNTSRGRSVSFGGVATKNLGTLRAAAEYRLHTWIEQLREKRHRGEIY